MPRFAVNMFISAALWLGLAAAPQARPLLIATDITPVQVIVKAVANGRQKVLRLVPLNVSSHDFTLRPSDLRILQKADLIVWLGPNATPGLARLMAQPDMADKALTLSALANTNLRPLRKSGILTATAPVPFKGGQADPHIWLDPQNVRRWGYDIAAALSRRDPEGRAIYAKGAAKLAAQITAVDARIKQEFARTPAIPFVQFHDAFQYFEDDFGLKPMGVATTADAESTSLGIVIALKYALAKHAKSCVFVATDQQAIRARALLETPGVRIGHIDPLGRNIPVAKFTYPALLLAVARGFTTCFAGR